MDCGIQVYECMASVYASDFLKFMEDEKTFVRERCGKCVVKEMIKDGSYVD